MLRIGLEMLLQLTQGVDIERHESLTFQNDGFGSNSVDLSLLKGIKGKIYYNFWVEPVSQLPPLGTIEDIASVIGCLL